MSADQKTGLQNSQEVTLAGQRFNVNPDNREISSRVRLEDGEVEMSANISWGSSNKLDLTAADLEQVYVGLEAGNRPTNDETLKELTTGVRNHNPAVGITVSKVEEETRIFVSQASPNPKQATSSHWQDFTIVIDLEGSVVNG